MKGLTFTPENALAVCEGRKVQTRRLSGLAEINAAPERWKFFEECKASNALGLYAFLSTPPIECRVRAAYRPGDKLALLTTWAIDKGFDELTPKESCQHVIEHVGGGMRPKLWHAGLKAKPSWCGKSRPGRFLPNHLRPLMPQLLIESVKCERVQDISRADAMAEGLESAIVEDLDEIGYKLPNGEWMADPKQAFRHLWDSINTKRGYGWAVNPWVFCYQFKLITP